MKLKAKLVKFRNFNKINTPCTSRQFSLLRNGDEVEVNDDIANEMLGMGIVEKVNENKKKKEGGSK